MIKLLFDFIQFLNSTAPLLFSLFIFAWLAILLAKSIKRHAVIYYTVMAIPAVLVCIPFICRRFGIETYNFNAIPFLGSILRDYIHMGTLGFPLLIIIMYMGALSSKKPYVKKLLSIRKELSILSGFPILTHSLVRVFNNFPKALNYFIDNDGYTTTTKVTNELGVGITNFGLVLGILMLALFIPLWATSFDSVRKRMGAVRWKKLQRLSYVLYATLFIHAMCLQVGYMLNQREKNMPHPTEAAVVSANSQEKSRNETAITQEKPKRGNESEAQVQNRSRNETERPAGHAGGVQSKGFSDIKVSAKTKRYIHMATLLLIFGSYLYLRLRKARKGFEK